MSRRAWTLFALVSPYAAHCRAFAGLRNRWRALLACSTIALALAWPLIGLAEQRISSSLTP